MYLRSVPVIFATMLWLGVSTSVAQLTSGGEPRTKTLGISDPPPTIVTPQVDHAAMVGLAENEPRRHIAIGISNATGNPLSLAARVAVGLCSFHSSQPDERHE